MDGLILAAAECDPADDIVICAPDDVNELFDFTTPLFSIGPHVELFGIEILPFNVTRTVVLIFLGMLIVLAIAWTGLRRKQHVPTKWGLLVENLMQYVRNDIAVGIIGPEGSKYFPWLVSIFFIVLTYNTFEVTPFINFPVTSRMAIPLFLALITYVVFVFVGFKTNGISYLGGIVWPKSVPVVLRPLVGLIEFVSIFLLRPITLAIRLFANLVAGHLMLTLLLVSAVVFISNIDEIGLKAIWGAAWFAVGMGIFLFEVVVIVLQAYIFTLLSAVYVETSLHAEH